MGESRNNGYAQTRIRPVKSDDDIRADVDRKTAILLLAKGRRLLDYLAAMDLRSRIVAVTAIDGYLTDPPLTDKMFESFLLPAPGELAALLPDWLDVLGFLAREEIAGWTPGAVEETMMEAGHLAADAMARRLSNG